MMLRRALYTIPLVFLAVLVLTSAGHAQAPADGENVVVISVAKVDVPGALPGLCQVSGTISDVWSGKAFRKGQAIALPLPCGSHDKPMHPNTSVSFADPKVLQQSRLGVAHLSDAGAPVWKQTQRGYRGLGPVSGYRIYDGVLQPLRQAAR